MTANALEQNVQSWNPSGQDVSGAARGPDATLVFLTTVVIWITIFATFTIPGRSQPGEGEIDFVAQVKIVARLFAIAVLGWLIFAHFRSKVAQQIASSYWIWGLFALWAIMSTIWSPFPMITLGQAGGQLVLIQLSLSVAISYQRGLSTYLFNCIVALSLFSIVYGIGAIIFPDSHNLVRASDQQFVHPTAVASAASLGLVMIVCLLLTAPWKWVPPVGLIVIPIFVVAMLVAHNRTSLILTPLVCSIAILAWGKSHILAVCGVLAAIFGSAYLVFDPGLTLFEFFVGSSADFLHRGQTATQLTELSGREEMWSKMWDSYLESPILGHGYFVCSSKGTLYVWYSEQNHTAHNVILQSLVSSGLVGCILFVLWNLHALVLLVKSTVSKKANPVVITIAIAVGCWFAGWAMLNSSILGPIRPESAVYAITLGSVVGQFHSGRRKGIGEQLRNDHLPSNSSGEAS